MRYVTQLLSHLGENALGHQDTVGVVSMRAEASVIGFKGLRLRRQLTSSHSHNRQGLKTSRDQLAKDSMAEKQEAPVPVQTQPAAETLMRHRAPTTFSGINRLREASMIRLAASARFMRADCQAGRMALQVAEAINVLAAVFWCRQRN